MRKGEILELVAGLKKEKGQRAPKLPFEWKPSILLYSHLFRYNIPYEMQKDYE